MEAPYFRDYLSSIQANHMNDFVNEVLNKARQLNFPIIELIKGQDQNEKNLQLQIFLENFLNALLLEEFSTQKKVNLKDRVHAYSRQLFTINTEEKDLLILLNIIRNQLISFIDRYSSDPYVIRSIYVELDNQYLSFEQDILSSREKQLTETVQKLKSDLEQRNVQLEKINKDLDNFAYAASTDLKGPVANIEGLMDAMLSSLGTQMAGNEDFNFIMQMLNRSVGKFKDTIQDLADMSRIQVDLVSDVEDLNVCKLVEEVRPNLGQEITQSGAIINMDTTECPTIRFSRRNFKNIIYQLLSNSIKYRVEERTPVIDIKIYRSDDFVVLSISDNGAGMGIIQKRKLFSMFKGMGEHVGGTGIGLYIVKRIVDNNNGKIEVDTELGKGTTIRVFLKSVK